MERNGTSSVKSILFFSENGIKYMTVLCGKKVRFLNGKRGGNEETPGIARKISNQNTATRIAYAIHTRACTHGKC